MPWWLTPDECVKGGGDRSLGKLGYWHLRRQHRNHKVVSAGLLLLSPALVTAIMHRQSMHGLLFGSAGPLWIKVLAWAGIVLFGVGGVLVGVGSLRL